MAKFIRAEPERFKAITFNNGTEFHSNKKPEAAFPVTCYFASPHHPWERSSNENFVGLLRQYIHKRRSPAYFGERKPNASWTSPESVDTFLPQLWPMAAVVGVAAYSVEFKREAIKQVVEGGHPVSEVASRLGVSSKSIYSWLRDGRGRSRASRSAETVEGLRDENVRLKNGQKRTKEERGILRKRAVYFAKASE
jgi:transposase